MASISNRIIACAAVGSILTISTPSLAQSQHKCPGNEQTTAVEVVGKLTEIDSCAKISAVRATEEAFIEGAYALPSPTRPTDAFPQGYGFNVLDLGFKATRIADGLYPIGPQGQWGYRALQVTDGRGGSAAVDHWLGDEPFALTEQQLYDGRTLRVSDYLLNDAHRDTLGTYVGDGQIKHLPSDYHGGTWGVRGYPARVYTVSLAGEDSKQVAISLRNVSRFLSDRSTYTGNYNRPVRYPDFDSQLRAYRSWLLGISEPTLSSNEMTALVLNLGLNVPHNVEAYDALWPGEGQALFDAATAKGFEESDFEPLWEKMGYESAKTGLMIGTGDSGPIAIAPLSTTDYVDAQLRQILSPSEQLAAVNELAHQYGMRPVRSLCEPEFREGWTAVVRQFSKELETADHHHNPFRAGKIAYPSSILSLTEAGAIGANPHVTISTIGTAVDESDVDGWLSGG